VFFHFAEKVQVNVGDEICVAGYIMDHYCINRGTLLDRSSIVTLSSVGPSSHSVHCLVDVGVCRRSSFEILKQTEDGSFGRAWRLDDNSLVLSHARDIGSCSTCNGGSQTHGYKSTIFGKVMDLGSNSTPAMIEVTDVQDFDVGCGGVEYEPPSMVMDAGGGSGMFKLTFAQKITLHASLMLVGWGLLLPSGVVIARFSKHRKDAFWYKVHRTIQPIGILLAFIAWIIALLNFSALGNTTMPIFNAHAVCGMITMSIGIFQPINAVLRPHLPSSVEEEKSEIRVFWEYLHKGLGYLGVFVLAPITIVLGTYIVPTPDEGKRFQVLFGISAIIVVGVSIFFILEHKRLSRNK